jgi:hypothetical protein
MVGLQMHRYGSMVEYLLSMCEALGLILSTTKRKKKQKQKK